MIFFYSEISCIQNYIDMVAKLLWREPTRTIIRQLCRSHSTTSTSGTQMTSAGIIVVGDEILRGEVLDTNSHYLSRELHKMGVQMKKISVIGDKVESVSEEVKYFSGSFHYVLTTGGIGPTHDDITYEAVAKAFNEKLILNPVLRDICLKFYDTTNVDCPGMKLAYIPQSAQLNYNTEAQSSNMTYPNVSINNVYMFPGIPELLRKSFSNIKDTLFKSKESFYSKCIFLNTTEDRIVHILDILVKEFPEVQFGSYPKLFDERYKIKVTMESCKEECTRKAYEKLMELLPEDFIVNISDTS
ncbi:unnamed protein product [Phaedon cochleariae]|uniref:MoaB/Mog domain-containing protein n=1 Tax=Phaedon cochleariae TaxID=80249 RepID=A0A9P0GQL6_PHACE|nr:unnamed protein product [Phaedon cochleariae]